jgi:hypothetical protein
MPAGVAAGVSIGGSVLGGVTGMDTASQNGQLAQQAEQKSNQTATNTYNTNSQNYTPYTGAGSAAAGTLEGLTGGAGSAAAQNAFNQYLGSTNYQFQLQQGENAIKTQNAPAYISGATAKALNNYAQGQAGSALQGYEGLLENQTGTGASSASALGQLGSQYSNQISQNTFAGASGQIGANNQSQTALNGLIGGVGQGLSSFSTSPLGKSLGTSFSNAFNPATPSTPYDFATMGG